MCRSSVLWRVNQWFRGWWPLALVGRVQCFMLVTWCPCCLPCSISGCILVLWTRCLLVVVWCACWTASFGYFAWKISGSCALRQTCVGGKYVLGGGNRLSAPDLNLNGKEMLMCKLAWSSSNCLNGTVLLGPFLLWHFSDVVLSCSSALNTPDTLFVKLVNIFSDLVC